MMITNNFEANGQIQTVEGRYEGQRTECVCVQKAVVLINCIWVLGIKTG